MRRASTCQAARQAKKSVGRPTKYTPALGRQICLRLAEGESLRQICSGDKIPRKTTVLRWLFEDDKRQFHDQYVRAREIQAENWADEILEIADDGTNDWIEKEGKNGNIYKALNAEHVQRSRLRVDSRKWLMSKLLPKKYGDKQQMEHSGEIRGGVMAVPTPIEPEEWAAKAKQHQAAVMARD